MCKAWRLGLNQSQGEGPRRSRQDVSPKTEARRVPPLLAGLRGRADSRAVRPDLPTALRRRGLCWGLGGPRSPKGGVAGCEDTKTRTRSQDSGRPTPQQRSPTEPRPGCLPSDIRGSHADVTAGLPLRSPRRSGSRGPSPSLSHSRGPSSGARGVGSTDGGFAGLPWSHGEEPGWELNRPQESH